MSEGDDPLTFTEIRRELSLAEDNGKLLRPPAQRKVRQSRQDITDVLKMTLPEITETKDYITLLENMKGKILAIKNVALSDVRRFKKLRRFPSAYYETIMRTHIHDQLLPYLDTINTEITFNELCHGLTESTRRWITEKIKSLIMTLCALENIEVKYFD